MTLLNELQSEQDSIHRTVSELLTMKQLSAKAKALLEGLRKSSSKVGISIASMRQNAVEWSKLEKGHASKATKRDSDTDKGAEKGFAKQSKQREAKSNRKRTAVDSNMEETVNLSTSSLPAAYSHAASQRTKRPFVYTDEEDSADVNLAKKPKVLKEEASMPKAEQQSLSSHHKATSKQFPKPFHAGNNHKKDPEPTTKKRWAGAPQESTSTANIQYNKQESRVRKRRADVPVFKKRKVTANEADIDAESGSGVGIGKRKGPTTVNDSWASVVRTEKKRRLK
ncbi:unnamed protein product [Periconia digitata]|uniref:Uncharacterized protein n=1 Tax=Periconia digitata TaxID=1303443 RepID=A0A9W4UHS5_9PLEO|nr:unnamed protein product [Periconia digitata]